MADKAYLLLHNESLRKRVAALEALVERAYREGTRWSDQAPPLYHEGCGKSLSEWQVEHAEWIAEFEAEQVLGFAASDIKAALDALREGT